VRTALCDQPLQISQSQPESVSLRLQINQSAWPAPRVLSAQALERPSGV